MKDKQLKSQVDYSGQIRNTSVILSAQLTGVHEKIYM